MAKAYRISKFVFDKREKSGWSLEKVLTTPTDTKKGPKTYFLKSLHFGNFKNSVLKWVTKME